MNFTHENRAFQRIAADNRVRVKAKGRTALHALAINISLGGLALTAAQPLPVGTPCEVAISLFDGPGAGSILARGTVVRSGPGETAIQFARNLDQAQVERMVKPVRRSLATRFLAAYVTYFQVSQDPNYTGCEKYFGVGKATFRKVMASTFAGSIAAAVAPVFLLRHAIPPGHVPLKLVLALVYGLLWLGILHPLVDLSVFKVFKLKSERSRG
jgi:hypothetical protein